jgi:lipoprotein-anchoring transpeptidase ErfK/SrfK
VKKVSKMHDSLTKNTSDTFATKTLSEPERFIIVDISSQSLIVVANNKIVHDYKISTSKFGIGNKEGSYKTPTGIHLIAEKIGDGAPKGRIFRDRKDTGIDWHPEISDENMILTRIIRLRGIEDNINRGPGIDSYDRYIYIHGTNKEELIGIPMSHGCICMKNSEIIDLFNIVEEGTIVFIN